ncbi:hypothetical protein Ppa06_35420 [Planomonospora parontospora subsp. parontospora]|uniref:Uncharacterized protein n=2 Tax=Planomonospora parontospora TaxID=58119 RepID=A0AA37F4V0_9ACTN|nr:hypothetical protein [Planomonospora parontospora]GGK70916.1 hypothetical protein GCM10010126_33040 [Planomonospora parontospora]GII09744.1 hypothetical protein Ppa06_35420 [Planomonospora parontospora subsp. parontospora]
MAEKTLSTARLAEAIRRAADPEPAAAARPGTRPVGPAAAPASTWTPAPALPRMPASVPLQAPLQAPAAPRPSNRSVRTAGGHDRRAEGVRRGQGHRVPAHRPRRVPGRG